MLRLISVAQLEVETLSNGRVWVSADIFAHLLGYNQDVDLLQQTLDEAEKS